ncbi:MAG: hypothetical protein JOY96_08115 [Verrucomicrobia bacterium]|nr:hypothetical protein [Verrucomicrobiota bacterium]
MLDVGNQNGIPPATNKIHEAKRHKERALFSDIIVETNLSLSLNASLSL